MQRTKPRTMQFEWIVAAAWLAAGMSTVTAATPLGPDARLQVREGRFVDRQGRAVTFWGVNLFQSHLMWSRRRNPAEYERALQAIASQGFNAVRMPLNMAWFEPRPDVFPDHPRYEEIIESHGLPTGALDFYDGLIRTAGGLGLYVIPEFHELPADPYRWFVGGEERDRGTDKPGQAIAWMAVPVEGKAGRFRPHPELVAEHVPKTLGWLAAHWRDVPNIAGIEIPMNEPRGPLTEGEAYFRLCRDSARAVKEADPKRLVFMNCVDWGAMVNRLTPESVWRIPEEVDGLFPHFYPGAHSTNSGEAGTWSTTMANWASWLMGSGRPVMVGEYGVVLMERAAYWKESVTDEQRARTYAACAAQWYAMGIQGAFCWAWGGGIGWDPGTERLVQGAQALRQWAAPFRETVPNAAQARIAVVCAKNRRAQYGDRKDLWRITDALLDAHLTPFATVFEAQVAAQPEVLNRFEAILLLEAGLNEEVADAIEESGARVFRLDDNPGDLAPAVATLIRMFRLDEKGEGLPPDIAAFAQLHGPDARLPSNVLVGYARRQATVFERKGREGKVTLRLRIPGAEGDGRLVREDGTTVFSGGADRLAEQGASFALAPWETCVLRWK